MPFRNLPFQKRLFDRSVFVPPLPDKRVFQPDAVRLRNLDLPLPQRLYVFAVESQPFPELRFVPDNDVRVSASLFRVNGDKILRALFPIRKHERVHKVFRLPDGQRTRLRERNDELRRQPRFALPCSFAFVAAVYLRIKVPFFDGFFKIGGLYFLAAFIKNARVFADAVRFLPDIA